MTCLRDYFQSGILLDGRYETISPLNHGSFGMVFLARDIHTDEKVAIKCLTKKAAADDAGFDFAVDDKSEEQLFHQRLGSHPNIVNLLHSFETDFHTYLVLEYCSRGDLYEAIRNGHGPLETEHVRQFMLELVDAVAYSHGKGVYHRDIKPENIFLTQSGSMKLGDFGLATTDNWTLETTVGSDRYMSPEQYDSAGAGYSPAQADIWAIGICLLNVLFSRNPFTTPTEADPLFLDFSRDKQSLFDVFPSMSQDTYEVIVQCMNLDPRKRSLVGARAALLRVVSFTTSEEDIDEFCSVEQPVVASANREPLRTPSIQSPQMDQCAFPWTKALHASPPQAIRQLSVIPDNESYSEDLFSKSQATTGWLSASAETTSMSSTLDSRLGASMKFLAGGRPGMEATNASPKVSLTAGSLPVAMSSARNAMSSTSFALGRLNDIVSKSWSDMWDEDIEEEEEARRQLETLREMNSRTWSHESEAGPQEPTANSDCILPRTRNENDVDVDLADGFFFQEAPPANKPISATPRYSPPPKRSPLDKWVALGERRRAFGASPDSAKSPDLIKSRCQPGFGYNFVHGTSTWDNVHGHGFLGNSHKLHRERNTECPWNRGRDWHYWRREKRHVGDLEWVGGWQESHS
ncbi:serine/threonine-protein kinase ksp1 [Sodiomyces alkalinus F11]|uniref:Autophagy-related protein 1 n=1 Tax=Sodiomyces alkalinus (strain CBS 110278 / VKM F-3762 / F11) TaxID=1314773 RepID=A0A3N2PWW6_SODAK|nr:serine/threonine-protein kinase ksp1 [Sodiomyces alkalinus F11]ROT38825.1 serine/threonine-protein kinase ksp1 [Sodiomyces alkalinus F11]